MVRMNMKSWNRLLFFAAVFFFALNTLLVKTLLNITSNVELQGPGTAKDLLKNKYANKQDDVLLPESKPQLCACSTHIDRDKAIEPTKDVESQGPGTAKALLRNKYANKQDHVLLSDSKPQLCASSTHIDRDKAIVLGRLAPTKNFLTIAIPTIKRDQQSYLLQTLDSLIKNTSPKEREIITVVIFAANFDKELNEQLKTKLESLYQKYFSNGFMQFIVAPQSFYPSFKNLKQNFGDSEDRILWRSKQVVDFAFSFSYCQNLSEYYLQLEDDVISSPEFVKSIQGFLEINKHKKWTTLEFSELGFIGKLVRSSDLPRLAQFMLFFYEDLPVDLLLNSFNHLNAQDKVYRHAPSSFQHIGVQSSLRDKKQNLKDRYFVANARKYQSDNPPAVLYSSIKTFKMYVPQYAYNSKGDYFWGKTPIMNDTFLVVFESPFRLSRVVIETGSETYPEDILQSGKLEASSAVMSVSLDSTPRCTDYRFIGEFTKGKLDEGNLVSKLDFLTKCIQVTVTKSQKPWLLIREIAVWVHKA